MPDATPTTTDTALDFASFEAAARAQGFDEVLERPWPANTVLDTHTHPFGVWARVAQGEFWLTCDGAVTHFATGSEFTLEAMVPHAERYGAEGARIWVARRHVRG